MLRIAPLLTALLLLACSATDEGEPSAPHEGKPPAIDEGKPPRSIAGNRYTNTLNGVTLQFPATWLLKTDQTSGEVSFDLLALGPLVDGISPNVSINLENHAGSTDWAVILPAAQQKLRSDTTDVGDYVEAVKEMNGISYAEIAYTATYKGTRFKFNQHLILNRGRRTTVTYTDLADRFDANADFSTIKASLSID